MKGFFITALVVASLATSASAQKTKGENEFGINVGYNSSTVTAGQGYYTNSEYRSGFNVGVSVDHYFSESWSIKGKLVYDQKGWNRGYIFLDDVSIPTNYHLDYLTVPVMANWHFGRTKNWYLDFGPYAGFLLSASETAGKNDVKDYLRTVDFGLNLGIGIKFPVSDKAKFFIELNGQGGFIDVGKGDPGLAARNSTSNINIGFTF